MANYDWRDHRTKAWVDRFPEGVRGLGVWRQSQGVEAAALRLLEHRKSHTSPPSQLRVFVSHKQADVAQAERVAYLACKEGFEYWLDVLDPNLASVSSSGATPQHSSAAIAAIIEMALLNCTHVLAVITQNTRGSQWVPYEYGRVKDPQPVTLQAACWLSNAVVPPVPEYLYLGPMTRSESDIINWLRAERQRHSSTAASCSWTRPVPAAL